MGRRKEARADNVTVPLGIPEIRVLKTEMNARGELIVTVESTNRDELSPLPISLDALEWQIT